MHIYISYSVIIYTYIAIFTLSKLNEAIIYKIARKSCDMHLFTNTLFEIQTKFFMETILHISRPVHQSLINPSHS